MNASESLGRQFEAHRARLRAVAYRMLGSLNEADDAVQEAWLRLTRHDLALVENLGGWLTTVVARVCLDLLRSRRLRREEPLDGHVPDPIVAHDDLGDPVHEAMLADSIGLALLVVLEALNPVERVAFVLHDMFGIPFNEIAGIVGRSSTAARQLASRARRRIRGSSLERNGDLTTERAVVDAFLKAARDGDVEALVAVLDPEVVFRSDRGAAESRIVRGARTVAGQALAFSRARPDIPRSARRVLVNGAPGIISYGPGGRPYSVLGFAIRAGKIAEIDLLADPDRIGELDLPAFRD